MHRKQNLPGPRVAPALCPLVLGSVHRKKGLDAAGLLFLQIWVFAGEAGRWPWQKVVPALEKQQHGQKDGDVPIGSSCCRPPRLSQVFFDSSWPRSPGGGGGVIITDAGAPSPKILTQLAGTEPGPTFQKQIFYSILFYSILFYSILFYSILLREREAALSQGHRESQKGRGSRERERSGRERERERETGLVFPRSGT